MGLSITNIPSLLESSRQLFDRIEKLYQRFPSTSCKRRNLCCTLLPEMGLPEFLLLIQTVAAMKPEHMLTIGRRLIRYFLINPVRLSSCPFLENGGCMVYEQRPLGCRAYGLWSPEHYEHRARENIRKKREVHAAWRRLGINLPREVTDFQLPYCDRLRIQSGPQVTDDHIRQLYDEVEHLGSELQDANRNFGEMYFSDPSFLTCSFLFGYQRSLELKVAVVKEILGQGRSPTLAQVRKKLNGKALARIFPVQG